MKKIINGKKYDTETAREIGTHSAPYSTSDFSYFYETLYRKRTGEFFLFGVGNAMSRYAAPCDGGWGRGMEICPLQYEAARKWAEENLSADEYEAAFGEVTEDESKTIMSFSLRGDTCDRIKRGASEAGLSLSAYLDQLVANAGK